MLKLQHVSRFFLPIILFLTFLVYSNTLTHQFVWDDQQFLLDWQTPKLGLSGIVPLLLGDTPMTHEGIYRPLRGIYYVISYYLIGENPGLYHLQAILIHLTATTLVFLIIKQLFKKSLPAFFGALVFGLHPVHVESITWVTSSYDSLGQTLAFLAFYSYLLKKRFLSVLLTGVAIFSHETAILLPLYYLAYELIFYRKIKFNLQLPYWGIALLYWLIRIPLLHITSRQPYPFNSLMLTLWYMGKVVIKYLQNLILPFHLTTNPPLDKGIQALYWADLNYQSPPSDPSLTNFNLLLSWGLILLLIISLFKISRSQRIITFSLSWILIALIPFLQFFPISALYADRYLYPASFGWSLFLAWFAHLIPRVNHPSLKMFFLGSSFLLISYYGVYTFTRNRDWQNNETLWQQAVKVNPASNSNLTNLANAYYKNNNITLAKQLYNQAVAINPSQSINYTNLGIIAYHEQDKKAAKTYFEKALSLDPPSQIAHLYQGMMYHQEQAYDAAKNEYDIFRRRYPRYPDTYFYLGMLAHEQQHFQEANDYYATALSLKPNYPDVYNNLGNLYRDEGKMAEAVKAYDIALQLNPKHPYAAKNLSEVLKLNK